MSGKIKYSFPAKPWQHSSPGGWYFVSLPIEISQEIRGLLRQDEEGWGRLGATARIGATEWKTAIWFDKKHNTYLLPLKVEIRKKERIEVGTEIGVEIWL
jgi:hypothetical protein